MAEYLVGQQQEQNIVAAVHTGDVVDSCGTLWQWENVSPPLLTIMEHIPLSILAGNHDLARERKGNKQYDLFAKREVIQRSWEGRRYISGVRQPAGCLPPEERTLFW